MDIVLRAAIVFAFILVVTRLIGRRELSSLEPFDLILLIVLGDFLQQAVTQNDFSVTGGLLAAGTISALTVLVSFVTYRFGRVRPLFEGEPLVLVQDGEVIERNARRERITVGEIAAEARLAQIASLAEVKWAVLETSGRISFIRRDADAA
jgi:uncharacterized membrane protein YcaP (DUF421 family)